MAIPNEVRFNVRHNVLLLKTFTVPQLQAITGLNRHSIHSEVKRMKKEKLVSEVGIEKRKKGTAGGRPPVIYQLTSDPEKRFEVLQSVRAFYIAAEERVSEPPRPESKHYFIAKERLEEVTEKRVALTQDEKAERLDVIQKRLEYARREEEVGEEGTQLIAASFDILEAKAIDTLAGDWELAIRLLDDARKVCKQLEADDLVAEVNSYVHAIVDRMTKDQREFDEKRMYDKVEEITRNLRIIKHRFGDLPEISTCVEQVEYWAEKSRKQKEAQQARTIKALRQLLRDLIPEAAKVEYGRMSELAFIPGSSLHGKMRSLAEVEYGGISEAKETLLLQLFQEEEQQSYGPN